MIKLAVAKKRMSRAVVAALVLGFALSPAVYADSYPYMKVFGGDTWAGGAFESGGLCTPSGSYQDPANGGGNKDVGGILAYGNSNGGGSSDEFGALSFGTIDTSASSGTPGGFYSNGNSLGKSTALSFASSSGGNDGGLFEGATPPQSNCIPDYYSQLRSGSPAWSGNYNPAVPTQYQASSDTTLSGAMINAGTKMTLFVSGNVWISGNICYMACNNPQPGYNETNVPKFGLVVKGNIFIEPGVTQLDGLYVAEPTSGTTNGVIWTCHDNLAETTPDGTWLHGNCNNKLTVNGALIAQQVNFTRSAASPSTPSDVNSGVGAGETSASNNASEVINYTPATVIGGPFLVPTPPPNSLPIQYLISLPPLF